MSADPYAKTISRLIAFDEKWWPLLDLGGHRIKHRYVETTDGDGSTATTEAQWQYRDAVITWYLPDAIKLTPEDLELTYIHECVHVLLNPIRAFVPEGHDERNELATENVARALYSTMKGRQ